MAGRGRTEGMCLLGYSPVTSFLSLCFQIFQDTRNSNHKLPLPYTGLLHPSSLAVIDEVPPNW